MLSLIKRLFKRIRAHRFWGISLIAWWLLAQGALFALILSLAVVGRSSIDMVLFGLMGTVAFLVGGMRLRQRVSLGWWAAVFLLGLEISRAFADTIPQVIHIMRAPAYLLEAERSEYVMGLFWGDFFYQAVLNALCIAYLVRPKIRKECGIDWFTRV